MQGEDRKRDAMTLAREKLNEGFWVRIYGPDDKRTELSDKKYVVAWKRRR